MIVIFVTLMAGRNVFIAAVIDDIDGISLAMGTAVVGFLVAGGLRVLRQGTRLGYDLRPRLPRFIILGIGTAFGLAGANLALGQLSPVLFTLMDISLYPVLVSVIGRVLVQDEEIRLRRIFPLLGLAALGILLFSWHDLQGDALGGSVQGFFWTALSVAGWATSVIMISQLVRQGTPVLDVISFRFTLTPFLLAPLLVFSPATTAFAPSDLPAVIILGALGYAIPFMFSFTGLRNISVITFSIYTMLTPVFTFIFASWLLDEPPLTALQILGALIIFAALLGRTADQYRQRQRAPTLQES
ncbi:MAG: DMT family transporter [Anaerolineales bacterium]